MRSISTMPFSMGGRKPIGGDKRRDATTQDLSGDLGDNFGDWGVKGVRTHSSGFYGMMGVACTYLDLFARKPYDWSDPKSESYRTAGGRFSAIDMDNNYERDRDDETHNRMWSLIYDGTNNQPPNLALDWNTYDSFPLHHFAGSDRYCCANAPLYNVGGDHVRNWGAYQNRVNNGFDLCSRNGPNNWDFPNMGEHPEEQGREYQFERTAGVDMFSYGSERRFLKQSSIHHHTCADIRNATHFSTETLAAEEWDMFVEVRLSAVTDKTYVNADPTATYTAGSYQLSCPVSNTAGNALMPGCYSVHVQLMHEGVRCRNDFMETTEENCVEYGGPFTLDVDNFDTVLNNWKANITYLPPLQDPEGVFPGDYQGYTSGVRALRPKNYGKGGLKDPHMHCGYKTKDPSGSGAEPNELVGNVNWGKVNVTDESSYTPDISPYSDGKTDGVLECLADEAHDLLLHGFLKNAEACMPYGKHLLEASPCQNPRKFNQVWRKVPNTGYTLEAKFYRASNGREMPLKTEPCQCPDVSDLETCSCGALARSSRMVISKTWHHQAGDGTPFDDKNPHAPKWVTDSASVICNVETITETNVPKDRGNVPLRACPMLGIQRAPLWNTWQWDDSASDYFRSKDKPIKFLRSSHWNPFELDNMAKCANSGDCEAMIDLSVPVSGNSDHGYVMYKLPFSGKCYEGSILVVVNSGQVEMFNQDAPGRRACLPLVGAQRDQLGDLGIVTTQITLGDSQRQVFMIDNTKSVTVEEADQIYYCSIGACGGAFNNITLYVDVGDVTCGPDSREVPTINVTGTCFGGAARSFLVDTSNPAFAGVGLVEITDPLCVQEFEYLLFKTCSGVTSSEYSDLILEPNKPCLRATPQNRGTVLELDYAEKATSGTDFLLGRCPSHTFGVEVTVNGEKYCEDRGLFDEDETFSFSTDDVSSAVVYYDAYRYHNAGHTAGPATEFYLIWGRCGINFMVDLQYSGHRTYYQDETGAFVESERNLVPMPSGQDTVLIENRFRAFHELCLSVLNHPFARKVSAVDFTDTATLSMTLGDCQQCVAGRRTALIGVDVYDGIAPIFMTDSPVLCYEACVNSTECVAMGYRASEQKCTLFSDAPTLGYRAMGSDFSLDVSVTEALVSGMDSVIFCLNGTDTVLPPAPPLPQNDDSGCEPEFVGVVPNCIRSECDPTTHRAVPLNPKEVGCDSRCQQLCGNTPHRSLQDVVNVPNITEWGTEANTVEYDTFFEHTRLPFSENPYFLFSVNDFTFNETSPASISILLPVIATTCESVDGALDGESFSGFTVSIVVNEGEDNAFTMSETVSGFSPDLLHKKRQHIVTFEGWPASVNLDKAETTFKVRVSGKEEEVHNATFLLPGAIRIFCNETLYIEKERERIVRERIRSELAVGTNVTDDLLDSFYNDITDVPDAIIGLDATPRVLRFEYCRTNTADFHICVPHSRCSSKQYKARDGDLNSDTVCIDQPHCTWGEYVQVNGTATTARVCAPHPICKETETSDPADEDGAFEGDLYTERQCVTRRDCSSTEFRKQDGNCAAVSACTQKQYVAEQSTLNTDNVCRDIAAECTALEYETAEPTGTSDRKCTSATLCRSDEYVQSTGSEIEDRTCSPIVKCSTYEIETQQGSIESQTVCTSILQWSSVWVYTAVGAGGFLLAALRGWGVYAV